MIHSFIPQALIIPEGCPSDPSFGTSLACLHDTFGRFGSNHANLSGTNWSASSFTKVLGSPCGGSLALEKNCAAIIQMLVQTDILTSFRHPEKRQTWCWLKNPRQNVEKVAMKWLPFSQLPSWWLGLAWGVPRWLPICHHQGIESESKAPTRTTTQSKGPGNKRRFEPLRLHLPSNLQRATGFPTAPAPTKPPNKSFQLVLESN